MWLVQDHSGQTSRATYEGAMDVDVVFSPFFNALPIRRTGLYKRADSVSLPVVYVWLPELTVKSQTISYTSTGAMAARASSWSRRSPTPPSPSTSEGFIVDYPGLAERI